MIYKVPIQERIYKMLLEKQEQLGYDNFEAVIEELIQNYENNKEVG